MSLDTVLKIGKIYRQSKQGLDQHRYIKSIWKDVEVFKKNKDNQGNTIETVFYNLPVINTGEDFVFDFDNLSIITDEDKKKSLKYLNFKTSDRDSSVRYLLGDIIYKGFSKEAGNFRIKEKGKNSFFSCSDTAKNMESTIAGKFRRAFENNINSIESLLGKNNSTVLHFDFDENSWFDIEEFIKVTNKKLIEELFLFDSVKSRYAPNKTVFKTIKTPTFSNGKFKEAEGIGGATPNFKLNNSYQVTSFTEDEAYDLLYGINISEKSMISVLGDFSILCLPNPDSLSNDSEASSRILNNFFKRKSIEEVTEGETIISIENQANNEKDIDSFFDFLINNEFEDLAKFNLIFLKPKAGSSPSVDMLEISSIEKSFLRSIHERIKDQKVSLKQESSLYLVKNKLQPKYDIKASFLDIFRQKGKNQKKYSFHLLKVLPQIYTDTYYQDAVLLPAFIEKVECNIRDGFNNFNVLKYDFYFLTRIQKQNNMQSITESKSYSIGKSLGTMARPFAAWREDCPIKSFEKNYIGNLTRRIGDLNDLTKFSNFLNEKLTIHEKNYKDVQEAYLNLITNIKALGIEKEKYDKNNCALGFFESYFSN